LLEIIDFVIFRAASRQERDGRRLRLNNGRVRVLLVWPLSPQSFSLSTYQPRMLTIRPPVIWEPRRNMGSYSMAQVYPPSLSPLPFLRATPRSTPLSGRLGLRVSSVKLKTLNAFYGHFRSFAHHKPYIKKWSASKDLQPCNNRFSISENLSW
jgi:hypothetical protein